MRGKKQMQLLGMLDPAETPELKSAAIAIGNVDTEQEIADILSGYKVSFLKTFANYEGIWNISGLRKSELVAKIAHTTALRFDGINRRHIIKPFRPAEEVYLMRTQGITPDYVWDRKNWDKDNPDGTTCTYRLPNDSQPDENTTAEITPACDNNATASQPAIVATVQSETNDKPEITSTVLDDLAARIVKADDFNTICYIILRSQTRDIINNFAQAEEINIPANSDKRQATAFIAKTIVRRLETLKNGHDVTFKNMFGMPAVLNSPVIAAFYKSRVPHNQKRLIPLDDHSLDAIKNKWPKILRNNIRMCVDCETADEIRALLNTAPNYDLLVRMADEAGVRVEYNASRNEIIDAFTVACMNFKATLTKSAAPAVSLPPDNLYDDGSFSDFPGDNSCPDMDIPDDHTPDAIPHDNNPLHHLKPCPNCRSTHIPFLKLCNSNNFSYVRCTDGEVWQHIYYRLKCRDCGHEVTATIYRTGLGHVIPHQNKADVKKEVFQAWNKQYDDNPGFTVVPSEHIEKTAYTVYPEHITDECPYVTVYACETPTLTHAAVVPYAEAAPIRKIFRLIAIFLRLWLAMHPTPSLQPLDDFPDGLFTHYPTRNAPRKKFNRAVFEVGYSYSASCYSPSNGLQSFSFLVTGRVAYTDTEDKRKGVFLFVTCNSPDDHDFEGRGIVRVHTEHGVEIYNHNQYYEMGYGWRVFSFRADKRDNVPYPFKDTTPSEPNYKPCGDCTRFISREFLNYSDAVQPVHAEINDITPQPKPQQKPRNHEHTRSVK